MMLVLFCFVFFFKQKTAYEMRISDWSSDVCSSDLAGYNPDDMVEDSPVTIAGWSPRNSSRGYSGPVTVREAFARSINTVAAKVGQEVGFRTVDRKSVV